MSLCVIFFFLFPVVFLIKITFLLFCVFMTSDDKKDLIMPSLVKFRRIGNRCLSIVYVRKEVKEKKEEKSGIFLSS